MALAIDWRKLVFFLCCMVATVVAVGFLGLTTAGAWRFGRGIGVFMAGLTVIMTLGLLGVTAGGVARMAYDDHCGSGGRIGSAFRFIGSRFLPLFLSGLLVAAIVVLAPSIVNGLVSILRKTAIGSFLTGVLLLPHVLFRACPTAANMLIQRLL
jgi:hypothetical protein